MEQETKLEWMWSESEVQKGDSEHQRCFEMSGYEGEWREEGEKEGLLCINGRS